MTLSQKQIHVPDLSWDVHKLVLLDLLFGFWKMEQQQSPQTQIETISSSLSHKDHRQSTDR